MYYNHNIKKKGSYDVFAPINIVQAIMMTTGKSGVRSNRKSTYMLTLLIVLLFVMYFYYGTQKEGFHIDEILAFECANSAGVDNPFPHFEQSFLENWHEKNDNYFWKYLTVQEGNQFSYNSVYHNLTQDNHPPLWFFILHTVSSVFPNHISKWMTIIPNIAFTLLTVVILYLLSDLLLKNKWLALITAAFWGGSVGTIEMVMFGRMYALLTLWATLLMYLHARFIIEERKSFGLFEISMLLVTFCGIMTQYFFLFFCFFLCGYTFFYLLLKKRSKSKILLYCGIEIGGGISAILFFPHMIKRLFFLDRGKQAVESFSHPSKFVQNIGYDLSVVGNNIFNSYFDELIAIICICICVIFILKFKKMLPIKYSFVKFLKSVKANLTDRICVIAILIATALSFFLLVTWVAPYCAFRYFSCIAPLIVLGIIVILIKMLRFFLNENAIIFICGIMVCLLIGDSCLSNIENLFIGDSERDEIVLEYSNYPVIGIYGKTWRTELEMLRFSKFSSVLILQADNIKTWDLEKTQNRLKNGWVLYIDNQLNHKDIFEALSLPDEIEKLYIDAYATVYFIK